ncbi:3-deoxy-D-manno-octulosonic acid transferase [Psychrobacter sp. F1192]|uniref:3-deoxy-D-manno-octulosonic acid transferase n=1 Tax=Psychrobacter coccoides TaxID=2818440 RepID=A0ABS3NN19_9GAMM|nr:3-deoxy-D-manno-octulosonic acid transferase [Psychrobacter coccoides]MBO1530811.1 3-deoxy-D-manno-octulosonic acid transferase [Psychrobacter coccoides]
MPTSNIPPPNTEPKSPSKQASRKKRAVVKPPSYYRLVIRLLKPLYQAQVWHRSHKRPNYQQEVAQRFGKQYPPLPMSATASSTHRIIWCHAVSLGETNTVAPLLDALLAQGYKVWLTNTTQTGHARGASRFAEEIAQGRMSHSYVPVDAPAVIETFLAHVQPIAALFVETELWANILSALAQKNIPSILVNGRLSATSFDRYQKISAVSASMMQNLTLIIAQDGESAKRFRELGAQCTQIRVAGSLKWVINTPKATKLAAKPQTAAADKELHAKATADMAMSSKSDVVAAERQVWVAASTHDGEESAVLMLQKRLLERAELENTLLIIVPRHPERFDDVATLITASGLQMARRSKNEAITADTQVYLADSMGELMHWYAIADVALVGGSVVNIGGHNPVEPMSIGTPVLMGRYTQSCQSVVDKLASVGALYQPDNEHYQALAVDEHASIESAHTHAIKAISTETDDEHKACADIERIYQQLMLWLSRPDIAKRAGQIGEQMTVQQQQVLTRQLNMIQEVIEQHAIEPEVI